LGYLVQFEVWKNKKSQSEGVVQKPSLYSISDVLAVFSEGLGLQNLGNYKNSA